MAIILNGKGLPGEIVVSTVHRRSYRTLRAFARVAATIGSAILRTPHRALRATAPCERFLGRVRRACREHPLVLGERQRARVRRV